MKYLPLNEDEIYKLNCIIGYVKYNEEVRLLLKKIDSLQDYPLELEDYGKVSFQVSENGDYEIVFSSVTQNPEEQETIEDKTSLEVLHEALIKAVSSHNLEAVDIYSKAIQRIIK